MPDKPHFPTEEEKVLAYWNEINAFHRQLEMSEGKPEFTFYDGPPFATGKPHYGHIAAGTIKVSKDFILCGTLKLSAFAKSRVFIDCQNVMTDLTLILIGCSDKVCNHEGSSRVPPLWLGLPRPPD